MSQSAEQAPAGAAASEGQHASVPAQPPTRWLPQTQDMPAPEPMSESAQVQMAAARPPRLWERVLAAAAHVLMLASLPGLAVALVIWLTQRRRSSYVATQAKDAVLWQVLSNVVFLLLLAALLVIVMMSLGGAVGDTQQASSAMTHLVGSLLGIYIVLVLAALFFAVSALVGAICALLGLSFHYPIVGRRKKQAGR